LNKFYKRSLFLVTVFILATACCPQVKYLDPHEPVFRGYYGSDKLNLVNSIKVVSFNIEFGEEIKQAISEFAEAEELRSADIICLQEMDEEGVELIAKNFKLNYVYYPSVRHKYGKNFGNAILSKWDISEDKKIILPYKNPFCGHKRIAISAIVTVQGIKILVYSIHNEVNSLAMEKRLKQVEYIVNSIPDSAEHTIIAGDFNTLFQNTINRVQDIFEANGLTRATKNKHITLHTGPYNSISFTLDHIFYAGLKLLDAGVYNKSTASDHLPVWAVFGFAE